MNYDPSNFYTTPEIMQPLPCSLHNTPPDEYFITTWGRLYIKRLDRYSPKELTRSTNFNYIIEQLRDVNGNVFSIPMHHLVAETFILGKPVSTNGECIVINHKDGIKWHNEVYNLEWITQSENVQHADANNLIQRPFGEDNGYSALTDAQYHEICKLTQEGYFPNEINKIMNLGINITNIAQKIRDGKSESIISQQYDFSNIPRNDYRKFTENQVRYICTCLQDYPELTPTEILMGLNYDLDNMTREQTKKLRDTISTIKRRVSYKEIGKDYNF